MFYTSTPLTLAQLADVPTVGTTRPGGHSLARTVPPQEFATLVLDALRKCGFEPSQDSRFATSADFGDVCGVFDLPLGYSLGFLYSNAGRIRPRVYAGLRQEHLRLPVVECVLPHKLTRGAPLEDDLREAVKWSTKPATIRWIGKAIERLERRKPQDVPRLLTDAASDKLIPFSRLRVVLDEFKEDGTLWDLYTAFGKAAAKSPPTAQPRNLFRFLVHLLTEVPK